MSTVSSKHRPRVSLPQVGVREVEFPHRVEKAVHEGAAIVLGLREPADGRYDTLSRQTYQTGARTLPGYSTVCPRERAEILADSRELGEFMRNKHFYWAQPSPGVLVSSMRGSHVPPVPDGSAGSPNTINRQNAQLMTTSSVFVSDKAVDAWKQSTSTNRADFDTPESALLLSLKGESRNFRLMQQGTHFTLGADRDRWNSENRTKYRGLPQAPATLAVSSATTAINIGSSDVSAKETLVSVKQTDFASPGTATPIPQTAAPGMNRTAMVFGYTPGTANNSLYRASYSPTTYVQPKAQTPSLPQGRLSPL